MARITVEDCLRHVDNRFDLVLLATRRARQLAHNVQPLLPARNDKPTVLALREIAAGHITSAEVQAIQRELDEQAASAAHSAAFARAMAEEMTTTVLPSAPPGDEDEPQ